LPGPAPARQWAKPSCRKLLQQRGTSKLRAAASRLPITHFAHADQQSVATRMPGQEVRVFPSSGAKDAEDSGSRRLAQHNCLPSWAAAEPLRPLPVRDARQAWPSPHPLAKRVVRRDLTKTCCLPLRPTLETRTRPLGFSKLLSATRAATSSCPTLRKPAEGRMRFGNEA
jgi:hypothetical protein